MTAARLAVTDATRERFPGVEALLVDLGATRPGEAEILAVGGSEAADHASALKRWRAAGAAVVQVDADEVGGRLRNRAARHDAHRTTDLGAGDGVLLPAVDPAVTNPIGWRREPSIPVASALHRPTAAAGAALAAAEVEVLVLVPPSLGGPARREAIGDHPAKRWEDDEGRRDRLARVGALVSDPTWDDDAAATWDTIVTALALGTPVVTTGDAPAALHGLPVVTADRDQLVATAAELAADDVRREQVSVVGRRHVLTHHTGRARLRDVAAELSVGDPSPDPRVSVLLATNRPDFVAHGVRSVLGQRHPDVELVLLLHGDEVPVPPEVDRAAGPVHVVRVPTDRVLGEVLNAGLDVATGDLVAKMDDDDLYGRDHLGDLVLAHGYRGADLVGKRIDHVHLADRDVTITRPRSQPERDRPHVSGPTLLATGDLLRRVRFDAAPRRVDSLLLERLVADGRVVYGTHALDVVLHRHGGNTWHADTEKLVAEAERTASGLDLTTTASEPGAYVTD